MDGSDLNNQRASESSITLRDVKAIALRHRQLISLTFLGILSGAILIAIFQPNRYEASLKILVKKDRLDAVVSADANVALPPNNIVTEEELNSEVVLLKSTDLLEKIVVDCNLQNRSQHGALGVLASILPVRFSYLIRSASGGIPGTGLSVGDAGFPRRSLLPDTGIHIQSTEDGSATGAQQVDASFRQQSKLWRIKFSGERGTTADWDTPQRMRQARLDVETTGATAQQIPEYVAVGNPQSSSAARMESVALSATIGTRALNLRNEENIGIAQAVRQLDKDLRVDAIKKTNLIVASYDSRDPQLAAQVLDTLANLYVEKHVAVHRPAGAFDFFQREAEKYRGELSKAEKDLTDFDREAQVVSAQLEKEAALQKLADFRMILGQTDASIAETQQRIQVLQTTAAVLPDRVVTQIRNSDDAMLISTLKNNLVTLEQKRIELLDKFEPGYRAVQEVEAQIAAAKTALAEKSQLHDETSDRDPTYQWTQAELAKAKADLAGLEARAAATANTVQFYENHARSLASKELAQADLVRTIKSAEDNYLLSLRKEEEARMSDALDQGRILNVAIAEPAGVPALPSNHRLRTVFFGFLLAIFGSAALAFASEYADSTLRTPDEVWSTLNVPVLAAIPRDGNNAVRTLA